VGQGLMVNYSRKTGFKRDRSEGYSKGLHNEVWDGLICIIRIAYSKQQVYLGPAIRIRQKI
jgi:hypothetical protein